MKKAFFLLAFIFLIGSAFFLNPAAFMADIVATLEVWLFKVYPSIFTFYILAALLINTKLINAIIHLFRALFKHLRFKSENSLRLFITSIFVGNPASASLICEALKREEMGKDEAEDLLKCSAFLNPFFIVSFLTSLHIKNALLIIFVHVFSNLAIALAVNRKNPPTLIKPSRITFSFSEIMTSVQNVIRLLLLISGIMVFANILRYSLLSFLNLLSLDHRALHLLIANMEISLALHTLVNSGLPLFLTLLLFSVSSSFAGVSIHLQVYSVIREEKLSYKIFLIHRLLQALLSGFLFLMLWPLT